jgi:hypothetical protein
MAQSHGSKATLFAGTHDAPDVLVDFGQFANSFSATFNRDTAETTTMKLGSKQYVPGLKDATVPYEGPFDSDADVLMWPLYENGTFVEFEYAPAGRGASGTPLYTGTMFVTSYEVSSEVGDANSMSGEFQVSGDVVRTIQP